MAFSTTHVSKKKMGSKKSQLRMKQPKRDEFGEDQEGQEAYDTAVCAYKKLKKKYLKVEKLNMADILRLFLFIW